MFRIRRGLDLPIEGAPSQEIDQAPAVRQVALVGDDYVGMRPQFVVAEGDTVRLGQLLFTDKKTPGVRHTSPGCGRVAAIHRGPKRKFESVVIELDGDDEETFLSYEAARLTSLDGREVRRQLIESGLWTVLRTRPFGKTPPPDSAPHSIFVTAMDTNPLAPDAELVIDQAADDFAAGVAVLSRLTEAPVHVCKKAGGKLPELGKGHVSVHEFDGPHPAGLPGTHIHLLDPASEHKTVWHVGYQDVITLGAFFLTGRIPTERIISLAGPAVENPRLLRTRVGAAIGELTEGELRGDVVRVISGSVLSGRTAEKGYRYLGRFHLQISAIAEGVERKFLAWIAPGFNRYSIKPVYASALQGKARKFAFTSSLEGEPRAIIPIGMYEKVMPLDIIATELLKALVVGDLDRSQALGCLELDEEDLALCSFVCPGKHDFGPMLRDVLTRIEKEG